MGNMLSLAKKAPTPKININPFVRLNIVTWRPDPDPETKMQILLLDKMFNGKLDDSHKKILESEIEVDMSEVV